jgi:hypothetical protein
MPRTVIFGRPKKAVTASFWRSTGANVDLDAGTIKIERGLEQTKAGLRFKALKKRKTGAGWYPFPDCRGCATRA